VGDTIQNVLTLLQNPRQEDDNIEDRNPRAKDVYGQHNLIASVIFKNKINDTFSSKRPNQD
jgi:hypothetical protein